MTTKLIRKLKIEAENDLIIYVGDGGNLYSKFGSVSYSEFAEYLKKALEKDPMYIVRFQKVNEADVERFGS